MDEPPFAGRDACATRLQTGTPAPPVRQVTLSSGVRFGVSPYNCPGNAVFDECVLTLLVFNDTCRVFFDQFGLQPRCLLLENPVRFRIVLKQFQSGHL